MTPFKLFCAPREKQQNGNKERLAGLRFDRLVRKIEKRRLKK